MYAGWLGRAVYALMKLTYNYRVCSVCELRRYFIDDIETNTLFVV